MNAKLIAIILLVLLAGAAAAGEYLWQIDFEQAQAYEKP